MGDRVADQNPDTFKEAIEPADGVHLEHDDDEVVEYLLDNVPQRVLPGLYIGSAWAEMNEPALTKAGITHILQVAQGLFPRHPMLFTYMVLQVEDAPSTDLVRHFPTCFEFIDKAIDKGGSVLVHCAAGVSRSATVVLGYLMWRHHLSLAAALEHLKAIRPWVAPNLGFMQQLEAYEAAKCDVSNWRPWCVVWYERQQQQQAELQSHAAPEQQQQQQYLQLPQPMDGSTKQGQQQQLQQHINNVSVQQQQPQQQQQQWQQRQQQAAGSGSNGAWADGCAGLGSSGGSNGGCVSLQTDSNLGLQPPLGDLTRRQPGSGL